MRISEIVLLSAVLATVFITVSTQDESLKCQSGRDSAKGYFTFFDGCNGRICECGADKCMGGRVHCRKDVSAVVENMKRQGNEVCCARAEDEYDEEEGPPAETVKCKDAGFTFFDGCNGRNCRCGADICASTRMFCNKDVTATFDRLKQQGDQECCSGAGDEFDQEESQETDSTLKCQSPGINSPRGFSFFDGCNLRNCKCRGGSCSGTRMFCDKDVSATFERIKEKGNNRCCICRGLACMLPTRG